MTKRYYTVEEVNALLPEIHKVMRSLQQAREDITLKRLRVERMKREQGGGDPDRFFVEEAEIEFALISARQQIDHLMTQSIEVRDIESGLVDFLSLVDEEEAYLCWRVGEPEVRYWHGRGEGFDSRKPISLPGAE